MPVRLTLTEGTVADCTQASVLTAGVPAQCLFVINQDLKDRKARDVLLSSDSVTLIEKRICPLG